MRLSLGLSLKRRGTSTPSNAILDRSGATILDRAGATIVTRA